MRLRSLVAAEVHCVVLAAAIAACSSDSRAPKAEPCEACRIELTRVVTLGADSSGFILREPIAMARDWRGRYYLTFSGMLMVPVYDSTGKPLFRIGRKGSGPGEYQSPIQIRVRPDRRFLVFDAGGIGKVNVLDSSYRFIRSYTQAVAPVVVLRDNRTSGNMGPLTVFDTMGRIVKTFGAPTEPQIDAEFWRHNRKQALGAGSTIWSLRDDTYHIERWSLDGQKLTDIVRTTDWYPPVVARGSIVRGEQPTPQPRDLYEDARGFLWVVITVASKDWHDHIGPPTERVGLATGVKRTTFPDRDDARMHDSMIEVIDPKTHRLVASTRVPGLMLFSLGDGFFASYREADDGTPLVDIWRATLVGDRR
jgi:hypothetical protein